MILVGSDGILLMTTRQVVFWPELLAKEHYPICCSQSYETGCCRSETTTVEDLSSHDSA